ncbi:hypothetical protein E3N88_23503 [Mikania micrantha]|uniref:Uncharacterized protein n=1 Tax=Mikania micrantha TaxID=192012 RepID=A0A5N6NDI5_9ASTR|nr:hypothetical protein E3N88_23503 [Mikania micrantha]
MDLRKHVRLELGCSKCGFKRLDLNTDARTANKSSIDGFQVDQQLPTGNDKFDGLYLVQLWSGLVVSTGPRFWEVSLVDTKAERGQAIDITLVGAVSIDQVGSWLNHQY